MSLGRDEVEKIAELAKLRFHPDELDHLIHQFQKILNYMAQLEEVSTRGIQPMYYGLVEKVLETPVRPDKVSPSLALEEVLGNAPAVAEGQFLVPKVIDE